MAIIHVDGSTEVFARMQELRDEIHESGFCVLRGIVARESARELLARVWDFVDTNPRLGTGAGSKELVRRTSLKWSVGGFSTSQANLGRFMLTLYAPLSDTDVLVCREIFQSLISIRELLAGRVTALTDENLPPGFFNATRFQIYPRGGGFMGAHRDTAAHQTFLGATDGIFLQPLIVLTEKGRDFTQGGGYVVSASGEVTDVEDGALSGDIVVYDERSLHGVSDVDPGEPVDMTPIRGRVVALATIYS